MSFLKNILSLLRTDACYRLPNEMMPDAVMKRVIAHWTAGSYTASALDREHYHFLVEGDGTVVKGKLPITANVPPLHEGKYAAHTRGSNSNSIGVSMCSMAGAEYSPFKSGKYPLTQAQWQRAAEVTASLCLRYGIKPTNKTVLTHAEVQANLGIKQNGKWDIARLPFDLSLDTAEKCGNDFRRRVIAAMSC